MTNATDAARPPYDDGNIFAKILRGEIPCQKIYESEHSLAFYDINPQARVHALIIPKGKFVSFTDFSQNATAAEMAGLLQDVGRVAEQLGVCESGYRLLVNDGRDARQEVAHLHFHLVAGEPLGALLARRD